MRWDETQTELLKRFANLGADAVAEIIAQRTGVERSPESVQRKASRMGLSLRRYEVCPRCKRDVLRLDQKTGLCPVCKLEEKAGRQERFRRQLEGEAARLKADPEYREHLRKYQRERQNCSRICRKTGLPSMRERQKGGFGDYV